MSSNNALPTTLEYLPNEIFLQIFAFLSLREIGTAFSGLNSNIDSIIKSVISIIHVIKYNDANAINLLHLFPSQIRRLVLMYSETVNFTSLINLRSLILKNGTPAQFNSIRPQHFPMLEILHIYGGPRISTYENVEEVNDLFQIILSNGFPRLRLCTAVGIAPLASSGAWSRSPTLRSLHLDMKSANDYEQLFYICPNLHRFTSYGRPWVDRPDGNRYGPNLRIFKELMKLEGLELENKFILDVNPMKLFGSNKPPPRFNKTPTTPRFHERDTVVIQGRILPQIEPYCRASFLIEIKLPPEYPFKVPKIVFLDHIYHPNVDEFGRHGSSWGYSDNELFKPTTTLAEIIEKIIRIIDSAPDYDRSFDRPRVREHQFDYQTFYTKALECTLSYGRPRY